MIQVFQVSLDSCVEQDAASRDLDPQELARAARFRDNSNRERWVASRLFLRHCLARFLSTAPGEIAFQTGPNGKPMLAGRFAAPALYFNLSHSGNRAILAISDEFDIGVDIEKRSRFAEMPRVANRVFTANERTALGQLEDERYVQRFFELWTCKEALIKATGEGMSADLRGIEVAFTQDGRPQLERYDDVGSNLGLQRLSVGDDYAAALAAQSDGATLPALHVTMFD